MIQLSTPHLFFKPSYSICPSDLPGKSNRKQRGSTVCAQNVAAAPVIQGVLVCLQCDTMGIGYSQKEDAISLGLRRNLDKDKDEQFT